MQDNKKPVPPLVQDGKPRRLCPVCGKMSYSRGGVHPQCAHKQADAPRLESLKAAKKAELPKPKVVRSPFVKKEQ